MRKLVLGIGATALVATAAFANDQTSSATASQTDETKVAALDTSSSAFAKLDSDHDGRVSAIEAANNSQLAAAFTQGDMDKDGYLSRDEFQGLSGSKTKGSSSSSSSSTQSTTTDSSGTPPSSSDTTTTTPQQ